jgi:hypothetical protein
MAAASGGCLSGPLSQGNAAQTHIERKVFPISCDDGRRYAAKALKTRNYEITSVDRNANQTVVAGKSKTESFNSRIAVQCAGDGVTIEPSSSSQWVIDGLRFTYYQLVDAGDRIWPPPTAPVVKMELYRGPEAKIEFPTELEPLGVVAVRVRVLNAGERTIRIDPRRVRGLGEGGRQVVAMAQADAERKLAGADPDIKSKLLKPVTLKRGEIAVGFVFFPAGSYEGASLALIDDKTGEADEYDASFQVIS